MKNLIPKPVSVSETGGAFKLTSASRIFVSPPGDEPMPGWVYKAQFDSSISFDFFVPL